MAPWPAVPVRCLHCQLLIGAGRSRSEPSRVAGAKGTAAGVFSRQAKRLGDDGDAGFSSPEDVLARSARWRAPWVSARNDC